MTAVSQPTPLTPGRRDVGIAFAAACVLGQLLFAYRYLGALADGEPQPFQKPLIEEMSSALSAGLLFFAVRAVAARFRLDQPGWARRIPVHLASVLIFASAMTSLMWGARSLLFPLVGLGAYDYGRMPHRYFMELPVQLIVYTLMTGGYYLADRYRSEREKALHAAQLEARLSQARLQNLELQLKPHFLFNAMNTVSAAMYEDAAAADEMLGHLAELLRASLKAEGSHEVPLRDELSLLDHYLSLMRARFGDRLRVAMEIAPDAFDCVVPALLLQPLLENAVRHGGAEAVGRGDIRVEALREGEWLRLTVHDDGLPAPPPSGENGGGLGLKSSRERLKLLYGLRHTFDAGWAPGGGFRVSITLPARTAGGA